MFRTVPAPTAGERQQRSVAGPCHRSTRRPGWAWM